jgi:hypothetical protein
MYDLKSTNNPVGWLHYFAAHLVLRAHVKREEVFEAIRLAANDAFENRNNTVTLSDNQVIMVSNEWFFEADDNGCFSVFDAEADKVVGVKINEEILDWWIDYIR